MKLVKWIRGMVCRLLVALVGTAFSILMAIAIVIGGIALGVFALIGGTMFFVAISMTPLKSINDFLES